MQWKWNMDPFFWVPEIVIMVHPPSPSPLAEHNQTEMENGSISLHQKQNASIVWRQKDPPKRSRRKS